MIHAFYREHNTLQKMKENFRLLEYKRKKYIQNKQTSGSKSPPRAPNSASPPRNNTIVQPGLTPPQKNFLTSIYGSFDNISKYE